MTEMLLKLYKTPLPGRSVQNSATSTTTKPGLSEVNPEQNADFTLTTPKGAFLP